jgi:biopolymer transport protein ExbB/TolQ/predicted  nucleic acid-binding Zn-ribbon protein
MAKEATANGMVSGDISGVRPSTDANIVIQLLAGLVGTVAVAFAVMPLRNLSPGIAYIYGIINERGPVQYFELFMAFMVLALVILKSRIVKGQLVAVAQGPISHDLDMTDDEAIARVRREVRNDDLFTSSILYNRIDRMLGLWLSTKDVSRIATWANSESERDANASDSSYAIARVLIWAIPILGFIGTVVGLGSAVSGFSEFLAGAAGLDAIKDAIGDVTKGLGMAFDTTLLALVLSVILMFPLSVVQRREENLFVEIDNYLDDMLMSRFPKQEEQPVVIENLEDSIEAAFRRYIPDPDRYEEVFTKAIDRAAGTVEERFGTLTKSYEGMMNDLTARLSASMATVGNTLEGSMTKVVTDLTSATEASADKSIQAAKEMSARMEDVAKLAAGIQDLLKAEEAVQKGLQGLQSSDEFQGTMRALREHLSATDEFVKKMNKPRVITLREEIS